MTEKRFKGYAEKTGRHHELIIIDSLGEEYSITDDFFKSNDVIFDIVDLLNVMNDTLLKQADENHKLSNKNSEQQAIIEAKDSLLSILSKENEQLRQELNGKDCRKCSNYCRDKALDYCLVDEREPYYFSFPFKWDYKAEAEKCKYYYR